MKLLHLAFLFCLSIALAGCSGPPAGTVGDENDPAKTTDLEPVDMDAEEAANSGN